MLFVTYLQHTAHPLEAVFLRGVRSLLGHHHDPLVPQHCHRKHGYPAGATTVKRQHDQVFKTAKHTCSCPGFCLSWTVLQLCSGHQLKDE